MNVLIIAAHPDDEVLGLGGTVLYHVKKGDSVYVAMLTDGSSGVYPADRVAPRLLAMEKCSKDLGIKKIFMLNFENQKLDVTPILDMAGAIEKVIDEIKPQKIYLHHDGDINQDHRAVYAAGIIATRSQTNSDINEVLLYETLSSTEANLTPSAVFTPNYFIDITEHLDKKISAFNNYQSEHRPFPFPRSPEGIKTLAQYRGMQAGVKNAEAFRLLWHRTR